MKTFGGSCVFLDRNDINTDEIIPARYLNTTDEKELASHCMEDIDKDFVLIGNLIQVKSKRAFTRPEVMLKLFSTVRLFVSERKD